MTPPGGDFDYEAHGAGYAAIRRPDPRIEALVHAALGDARTVLNVGAGAGSYEPADRYVIAIEPAAAMRARFLATMVSALAPHTPCFGPAPNGSMRQGPIEQIRQQVPSWP